MLQDGDLDIFLSGSADVVGANEVYDNDGSGFFTKNGDSTLASKDGSARPMEGGMIAVDLNDDGILDAILGNEVLLGVRALTVIKSVAASEALENALVADAVALGGSSSSDALAIDVAAGDIDGDGAVRTSNLVMCLRYGYPC